MNPDRPPSLAWHEDRDGSTVLCLDGAWQISAAADVRRELGRIAPAGGRGFAIDGSGLASLDTFAAFALLTGLERAGVALDPIPVRAMQERHRKLLALVADGLRGAGHAPRQRREGMVQRLGAGAVHLGHLLVLHSAFFGEVAVALAQVARRPREFRFGEAIAQFETVAIDAIPIVALVTLMIGVVFAYLLGVQAQHYGATIFVVDGVAIAVSRELSPIIVAVIVAGRSGAAFTAQIGLMKVQQETDALRVLGLSPIQVLVIPRLVAIMVALPLLVFVGDVAGFVGGAAISASQLGIPTSTFITRLRTVLDLTNLAVGLGKAPVFAAFIAMIACRMGLSVSGDARSVGEHTTSTVVQSIVWVILLDAAFAVTLQRLGI